jgi:glycosyltransferase involved in cell wall biosynthesis
MGTDMTPSLVSVIVPVYNGERYLAEAIQSVLNQDYRDIEVVVVDDGSTDRSSEIAEQFAVTRIIRQLNAGAGAATNTGIENARGDILTFIDADDLWEPGTLARRVARFHNDPDLDMTHGMVLEFVSPDLGPEGTATARPVGRWMHARLAGTTVLRRSAIEKVGLIDTTLKLGGWMDWLMRAEEAGLRTERCDDRVLRRRIHGSNLVVRERYSKGDYIKLLKRALDRRRHGDGPQSKTGLS